MPSPTQFSLLEQEPTETPPPLEVNEVDSVDARLRQVQAELAQLRAVLMWVLLGSALTLAVAALLLLIR